MQDRMLRRCQTRCLCTNIVETHRNVQEERRLLVDQRTLRNLGSEGFPRAAAEEDEVSSLAVHFFIFFIFLFLHISLFELCPFLHFVNFFIFCEKINVSFFIFFTFHIFHFFVFSFSIFSFFNFFMIFSIFSFFSCLPPGPPDLPKTSLFLTKIFILRHDSG